MAPSTEDQDPIGVMSDWFEERPINKANRQRVADTIHSRLSFVGVEWVKTPDDMQTRKEVRMLDYACGPGFLSKIFGPYVSSIKAVDVSPSMIERYKSNATSFGLSQDKINAVVGNLLSDSPEPSSLASGEYRDFDLITVGSALHHFGSTEEAMKQLAKRLKPGGALFVQDLYPDQDRDGSDSAKTRPRGYTEADMQKLMEEAGLEGFKFEVLPGDIEVELPNEEMIMIRCFIARATKPLA